MKNQILTGDSLNAVILQHLGVMDAPSTLDPDDPIFAGIDPEQSLGTVEVRSEDTDRFMQHICDTLTGPDRLDPDDKTFRP